MSGPDAPGGSDESASATIASWGLALFLTGCYTLSILDRSILAFIASALKRDLALTDLQLGLVQGFAFSLIYAVAGLPLGFAVDRFSRTRLIGAAIAVWSLATAACGLAGNFLGLFLGRVGVGVGEASLSPASYSIFGDLFPRRQLPLVGTLYQLAPMAATACAAWISGLVLGAASSDGEILLPHLGAVQAWRLILVGIGLPGLAVAMLVAVTRDPTRHKAAELAATEDFAGFMRTNWRLHLLLMVGGMLSCIAAYAVSAWTPSIFERTFHWSPARTGAALGILAMPCGLAGSLVGGALSTWCVRRGRDAALLFITAGGMAVQALSGASLFLIQDGEQFLLASAANLAVAALMFTIGPTTLQLVTPPRMRGRAMALSLFIAIGAGAGAGPFLVGAINTLVWREQHLEYALGLTLVIGCTFASALALSRFGRMRAYLAATPTPR